MRVTYTPEQTRTWTQADLDQLVGKWVDLSFPATQDFLDNPLTVGDWEGGSGLCIRAQQGSEFISVDWDWGMGWSWQRHHDATVSVCDEHDHENRDDSAGQDCLATLGPASQHGAVATS